LWKASAVQVAEIAFTAVRRLINTES
jgi:hypothetical protein